VYKNPLQAYQEVDKAAMSGREVEAYALTKAAMALKECQQKWESAERDHLLEQALKLNRRIWSIFQAELTRADNPMPQQIKNNILKLGAFIDQRSITILAEPIQEELNIIIAINENLAAGLRESVANNAESSHDEASSNQSLEKQHPSISIAP
jgi:flagellar protein FlaF